MTETSHTSAADEARAKAEARRKRILEKSRDRMGIVSGEQIRVPTTREEDDHAAAAAATAATTDAITTDADLTETDLDEHSKPSSGSARMNAMRRRRFAKKKDVDDSAAATDATDAVLETADTIPEDTTVVKTLDHQENDAVQDDTPIVPVPPTPLPLDANASPHVEGGGGDDDGDDDDAVMATKLSASSVSEPKKKYKGVAATRRQMLKDKAAKEQLARDEAVMSTDNKARAKAAALLQAKKVPKLPIYMYLFTVLLLFGVGLTLGTNHVVEEHVTVHQTLLAPQEHGMGILNLYYTNKKHVDPKTTFLQNQVDYGTTGAVDDEFGSLDSPDDDVYVPNIDPLFQLDLDKFTRGDSLMMVGARMAVAMHRINLYILYYLPLSIARTVFSIPIKLMRNPPVLCIFALLVRQFAKRVLGATLPDDAGQQAATSGGSKDVFGMIKHGIMTFLSKSFPTLVEIYDAFTHLRSDMFVMLCGIFVGLAWNHHHHEAAVGAVTPGRDEL
jgi:hypothetical protein